MEKPHQYAEVRCCSLQSNPVTTPLYFFRGLSVVPDEEVIDMYEGSHVPLEQMSDFYGKVRIAAGSSGAAAFPL